MCFALRRPFFFAPRVWIPALTAGDKMMDDTELRFLLVP
jgi:hypothetical protein